MSRRAALALAFLAGTVGALDLAAQERPDFSGHWSAQSLGGRGGRGGAPDPGSGWGPEFTIIQRADTLLVERHFFSPGDLQPPLRFRYALDGGESLNTVLMGRGAQEHMATARWEGETLLIVTRHRDRIADEGRGVISEVRYALSYEPSGRQAHPPLLVIETTRAGTLGGTSTTTRSVYTRG